MAPSMATCAIFLTFTLAFAFVFVIASELMSFSLLF